jgi:hypothetical protein
MPAGAAYGRVASADAVPAISGLPETPVREGSRGCRVGTSVAGTLGRTEGVGTGVEGNPLGLGVGEGSLVGAWLGDGLGEAGAGDRRTVGVGVEEPSDADGVPDPSEPEGEVEGVLPAVPVRTLAGALGQVRPAPASLHAPPEASGDGRTVEPGTARAGRVPDLLAVRVGADTSRRGGGAGSACGAVAGRDCDPVPAPSPANTIPATASTPTATSARARPARGLV